MSGTQELVGEIGPRAVPSDLTCPTAMRKVRIAGMDVTATDVAGACATIVDWISSARREYICVTGAHGIVESRRNPRVLAAHAGAGMVVPDGMPLVFLLRALGFEGTGRVYGPDLMTSLTRISSVRGLRQFYYGGQHGVAELLASTLARRHPGLAVAGVLSPPFRALERDEIDREIDLINAARADVVWVGLSTPKQELWMADRRKSLNAPVLIGVGAAFDFVAGTKAQAPRWMQRGGLEWSYRLASEPKRLWRRYAKIVPTFALLALTELARRKPEVAQGRRVR
jgi:N-acetylglucosaminyldiphosphoundecaprenol N-acetyl-beta-D-mannosaminyltransferase